MPRFVPGDSVRIDIPDQTDPDHDSFHGRKGEVIEVLEDDASMTTGDRRNGVLYRVRLEDDETVDFRWVDLRPR